MFFEIISIKGMNLLHSDEIAEGRYLHPAMMPELLSCTQIDVVNHNINLLIQKFNCLRSKPKRKVNNTLFSGVSMTIMNTFLR